MFVCVVGGGTCILWYSVPHSTGMCACIRMFVCGGTYVHYGILFHILQVCVFVCVHVYVHVPPPTTYTNIRTYDLIHVSVHEQTYRYMHTYKHTSVCTCYDLYCSPLHTVLAMNVAGKRPIAYS